MLLGFKLPNIQLPVDVLFYIGPYPVYNTVIISVLSALIILGIYYLGLRNRSLIPHRMQNFVEWVTQMLLNLCEEVAGKKNGRRFFPWVATIFLLALIANWWEVIPGVETIGSVTSDAPGCPAHVSGFFLTGAASNCIKPWLRPPSTDLNFTIALAVISVIATQVYGFKLLGLRGQLGRYFTLEDGPIGLVAGILELLLEPLRVISLGFRLFGNLFAGDILLLVITFLIPFVGAIPFYALEVFIGFIQAFVIAFLTLIFMTLGVTSHGHEEPEEEHTEERVAAERARAAAALSNEEVPAT